MLASSVCQPRTVLCFRARCPWSRSFSSAASAPPTPPTVSVVTYEYGHTGRSLPTWACTEAGSIEFEPFSPVVTCKMLPDVPGAFVLENVLSSSECDQLVSITEAMGFDPDAPVSLPHDFRHMDNVNWVVHHTIAATLFDRTVKVLPAHAAEVAPGAEAIGLNARFRCYRYREGDYFMPHTDGSWPGSLVSKSGTGELELHRDAWGDRWSQYTFLILLSDDYQGGQTLFYPRGVDDGPIGIKTPKGGALCFPHGNHPMHLKHAGEKVTSGVKRMIRTELLYRRTLESDKLQRLWMQM